MNISINVMALLLEVEIPSWLRLHLKLQELWPHILQPTVGQPVCALRPILQRRLQLKWPVGVVNLLVFFDDCKPATADGNFSVGFSQDHHPTLLTEIPTSPGPQRPHSSKWPMLLLIIETDCFLGKRWPTAWVLKSLGKIFLPFFSEPNDF